MIPNRTRRSRPSLERLELRECLSVTFQIDYSYDTQGFFSDPQRRALLQEAADTIGARLGDSLGAIVPGGGNSWVADFISPGTGQPETLADLTIPANTIMVFAGARPLSSQELGQGGYGGFSSNGSPAWNSLIPSRGQAGALASVPTDFGPWGGDVAFDTNTNWYFGTDPAGLKSNQSDFLSVALHEITHLIGFGTSPSWRTLAVGGQFAGPNAIAVNGGVPPSLDPGNSHWVQPTLSHGSETAMDTVLAMGKRKLLTHLDFAGLADLGWQITSPPNPTFASAIDSGIIGSGASENDVVTANLNDATMVVMYRLKARSGEVLSVVTEGTTNTALRVFSASAAQVAQADNGIGDTLQYTIPSDGTYYVGISGHGNTHYLATDSLDQLLAGPTGAFGLSIALSPSGGGGGGGGGGTPLPADLAASIAGPDHVEVGSPLIYTASISNRGPAAATRAALVESFPAGVDFVTATVTQGGLTLAGGVLTVGFGTIPSGGSASVTITIIPRSPGPLPLIVAARSDQTDPTPGDDRATATPQVASVVVPPPPVVPPAFVSTVQIVTSGKGAKQTTSLVITFSAAVSSDRALDLSNYGLTKPGKARRGKPIPRLGIGLKSVSYNGSNRSATVVTSIRGVRPRGLQLVVVSDAPHGITDTSNVPLDGDHNGTPGGNAVINVN